MSEARGAGRMEEIGARLRELRNELGLSLREVSEITSMNAGGLSRIENAKQGILLEDFVKLCEALHVMPGWVFVSPRVARPLQFAMEAAVELPEQAQEELAEMIGAAIRLHSGKVDHRPSRKDLEQEIVSMRAKIKGVADEIDGRRSV